ncbi:MAG: PAS domain S-box protein [Methanobacteriota archaeon]
MKERLRQSEELHRIILTNISDSVFLTNDRGDFTFICPNVDNIFGYSFEEIYAMNNIDALMGADVFDQASLERANELRNIERIVIDKHRKPHTVLVNVKKVEIMYGTRLFTCRDITEYKRVEGEMTRYLRDKKAVEKDLTLFFNLSADLFCILDAGKFKKLNPAWHAGLGYPVNDLIGTCAIELAHPDDRLVTEAARGSLKAGHVIRYENRYRHRDGSYRWISWNGTMSDDGLIHAVGRDITSQRREEDEMRRRLLTFRVETGRTYLVPEASPMKLAGAFSELLAINHAGLVISRRRREDAIPSATMSFSHLWMSERGGDGVVHPETEAILAIMEGIPDESVIVLDSLEYLVAKLGFSAVLSLVNRIVEAAFFRNLIVLLGIDPVCVSPDELVKLAKDTLALEPYPRADLSVDSMELLQNAYMMNIRGKRPTRTELCQALSISQPTLRHRVRELVRSGLLWEAGMGRSVVIEITEAGRQVLEKKRLG